MAEDNISNRFKEAQKLWQDRDNALQNQKLAQNIKEQTKLKIDTKSFTPEQRSLAYQLLDERQKFFKVIPDEQKSQVDPFVKRALQDPMLLEDSISHLANQRTVIVYGLRGPDFEANADYFKDQSENFQENRDHAQVDAKFDKQVAEADLVSKAQNTPVTRRKTEAELQQELQELEEKRKAGAEAMQRWAQARKILEEEFLPSVIIKREEESAKRQQVAQEAARRSVENQKVFNGQYSQIIEELTAEARNDSIKAAEQRISKELKQKEEAYKLVNEKRLRGLELNPEELKIDKARIQERLNQLKLSRDLTISLEEARNSANFRPNISSDLITPNYTPMDSDQAKEILGLTAPSTKSSKWKMIKSPSWQNLSESARHNLNLVTEKLSSFSKRNNSPSNIQENAPQSPPKSNNKLQQSRQFLSNEWKGFKGRRGNKDNTPGR